MSSQNKPLKKSLTLKNNSPISLALTTGRLIMAKSKDFDIADADNGIMGKMFVDPIALAEGIWKIYGDRINDSGVETEAEFFDMLDEKANRELDQAFKNAVSDFFTWGKAYVSQIQELIDTTEDRVKEAVSQSETPAPEKSGSQSGNQQES